MLFKVPVNRKAGPGFESLGDHYYGNRVESRLDLISSPLRSGFLRVSIFK